MYILVDARTNNFSSFAATQKKKPQYVVDERKNTQRREDVPGDRHEEDVDADADRIGDVWGSSCPGKSTC